MTTDNGHEFLNYDKIEISKLNEEERRTEIYYTDPYSSWQKGMNETKIVAIYIVITIIAGVIAVILSLL